MALQHILSSFHLFGSEREVLQYLTKGKDQKEKLNKACRPPAPLPPIVTGFGEISFPF